MVDGQHRKLHKSSLAFILARLWLFTLSAVGTEFPSVLGVRDGASAQPSASVWKKGRRCHLDLPSVICRKECPVYCISYKGFLRCALAIVLVNS